MDSLVYVYSIGSKPYDSPLPNGAIAATCVSIFLNFESYYQHNHIRNDVDGYIDSFDLLQVQWNKPF